MDENANYIGAHNLKVDHLRLKPNPKFDVTATRP